MKARGVATTVVPTESEARETPVSRTGAVDFPIVGVGASAGGLEAFEKFFRVVPSDSGMAFVLVQHLDPHHHSLLTEILQRGTALPVVEAQDQMRVAADHIYVIPPNRDLGIFHGVLQVSEPDQSHGRRLPIDGFLRSLAEDQGDQAIGVILSGTGTDGTLGLRAILGAGGISFVQEPTSAKFDGMPSSAIQSGFAMHVLAVEEMPGAILASARSVALHQEARPETDAGLRRVLMLLRSATGHDFSHYKSTTVSRRIERRMLQHGITDMELYSRYVNEHRDEAHALFTELLIRVTSFFRDPEAFSALKMDVLPELLAGRPADLAFRVWVAGCATGEEAYSIAILLREFMEENGQEFKVQLYSTDIDEGAIELARSGRYPPNIAQDVSPTRLRRFFIEDEAGYRVNKTIREMVVFAVHSVLKDPAFGYLDLLSCRNLMIYVRPEQQDRLVSNFHLALKPGGVLFLSPSESIGSHPDLFAPLNRKWKLYRSTRTEVPARRVMDTAGPPAGKGGEKPAETSVTKGEKASLAELTERLLLQYYAPASLITDLSGNILHVHGETGKYLRPAPGAPTLNVVDMAHEDLRPELRAAITAATSLGAPTLGREVPIKTDGGIQTLSFSVRPLPHADFAGGLLLLSLQAVAGTAPARPASKRAAKSVDAGRIEELERDLGYARETLRVSMEEQQASSEELKSTNEELQSTNEELQSANEELESSREELQSVNEELVTVNSELQSKIVQLNDVRNDIKNLFDSIDIGIIFLDNSLAIRHFGRGADRIYHLIASDVGRPLADIKPHLEGDDLLSAAQTVLETLVPSEVEVRIGEGAWYLARIRPYRTLDNVIDGVVMTFVEISEIKRARDALNVARESAEHIVDTVREPLLVLNAALQVVSASRPFYERFDISPEETVGRRVYELGGNRWDIPELRELLEALLDRDCSFNDYAVKQDVPGIGPASLLLNARRIVGHVGAPLLILLAIEICAEGGERHA